MFAGTHLPRIQLRDRRKRAWMEAMKKDEKDEDEEEETGNALP